ncbi:MAG: TIGR00730 family Rossman fold protein, partial [Ruminococcus bromii]
MNICVFGSSSEQIDKIYLESAEHLGKKIAEKGYNLVFGAGKYGVMGASARGAYSAGGHTIGVTPDFFIDVGVVFDKCSELIVTDTMRERKGIMEDKADAFVICAGGMGTFEEFFEVLTLKQLNRHTKPIII